MEVRIIIRRTPRPRPDAGTQAPPSSSRGTKAVRLMLTTLLFVATTVGGFETGRALWTYATMARAAEIAAFYARHQAVAHSPEAPRVQRAAIDKEVREIVRYNTAGLDAQTLKVVTTWPEDDSSGQTVLVRVMYPLPSFLTPLVSTARQLGMNKDYQIVVTRRGGHSSVG